MPYDVIVCGSLHMDIMVKAPDRPRRGETLTGEAWSLKPGGKGGNQAVEAARAGARTAMIGAIGDDDFGPALRRHLEAYAVDTSCVSTQLNAGTGMSVAIIDADGDYGAVIVSGVNLKLAAPNIKVAEPLFTRSRVVLLQQEVPDAANIAAARAARGSGATVILNAAPARPFPAGIEGLVDYLVVNEIEAEAMGARAVTSLATAAEAAASLLSFAATAVVTAGGTGVAVSRRNGENFAIAGHRVTLVSTHGAGDCFIGTLAAQLATGADLHDAVHYANAAAAVHVSTPSRAGRSQDVKAIRALLAT